MPIRIARTNRFWVGTSIAAVAASIGIASPAVAQDMEADDSASDRS